MTNGVGSKSLLLECAKSMYFPNWINSEVNDPLRITLADAVAFLQSHSISYALVGGLAASIRGQPRVTADVDLVIAVDISSALALAETLPQSKFRPLFDNVSEVIKRAFLLPLRHRQTNVKVDLALGLSGFEQQAVARAEQLDIFGTMVSVATSEDLLIMKVLAGRPQDEQDVQGLIVGQGSRLDWDYCLRMAAALDQAIDQDLSSRIRALRDH